MKIEMPEFALVVLVGPSGAGKSTFAAQHFLPSEVLSSDACRAWVCDDEESQAATKDAFELLHFMAAKRLANRRLTVVDATNVQASARKPLIELGREYHCFVVAIVFHLPERLCRERNEARPERNFGPHVIRSQSRNLRRSLRGLRREGFRYVYELKTPEQVDEVRIKRTKLWPDRRDDPGPFDIIGDIHGCSDELRSLLLQLGYRWAEEAGVWRHPQGRKAVFLGDLVDRGPDSLGVLRIARSMVKAGTALCVPGNHDVKLVRKLRGESVKVVHGLDKTLSELEALPEEERRIEERSASEFLGGLVSHYVLDQGRLVVAHAGMREDMANRASGAVRSFALWGETTGEVDEFGLPIRYQWARDYRGGSMVIYGHTPVLEPEWLNNTINIDTGCVFGGRLTALRYPELDLVSVPAAQTYSEPIRPLGHGESSRQNAAPESDSVLRLEDIWGARILTSKLRRKILIREENSAAALEAMSRYACDPRWLIYLPPTMSPSETAAEGDLLEHPAQAFEYYRQRGVSKVVCEEKHMGSRAVVIVCRDSETVRKRFGLIDERGGVVYTRTGRPFFQDRELEGGLLDRLRRAFDRCGLWDRLETDWACLDCEILPWSAKAQKLLRQHYAPVAAAARASIPEALRQLEKAQQRIDVADLQQLVRERAGCVERYAASYGRYCWPVESLDDYGLAPFHLLASEKAVHFDKTHVWHMRTLAELAEGEDSLIRPTVFLELDLSRPQDTAKGTAWWEERTDRGGEGMVVKPLDFVVRDRRGVLQPALKCRGREYLRIIYGPEYARPANLERLRARSLRMKRSLAVREFALGLEALERFVRREPLRRVHECVFGVLALESQPVDPRL